MHDPLSAMTLEEKINELIDETNRSFFEQWSPIEEWAGLSATATRLTSLTRSLANERSDSRLRYAIDQMIELADEATCLTSPSMYIREYKRSAKYDARTRTK